MENFDLIEYLRGKVPGKMLNPREISKEEEETIIAMVLENIESYED